MLLARARLIRALNGFHVALSLAMINRCGSKLLDMSCADNELLLPESLFEPLSVFRPPIPVKALGHDLENDNLVAANIVFPFSPYAFCG
jgi:hypothetical protein